MSEYTTGHVVSGEAAKQLMQQEAMKQARVLIGKDHIIIHRTDGETLLALLTADYQNMSKTELSVFGIGKSVAVRKLKHSLGIKETS